MSGDTGAGMVLTAKLTTIHHQNKGSRYSDRMELEALERKKKLYCYSFANLLEFEVLN